MKSPYTLAVWITWAVVISLTVLMSQGAISAQTSTSPPPITPEEKANWDQLWNAANDDSNPNKRDAARESIGKTMKRAAPYALDKVGKGLTIVGAGQIWYENYLQLSPLWRDDISETYAFDTEFRVSPGAIATSGYNADGSKGSVTMVTRLTWKFYLRDGNYYFDASVEGHTFANSYTYFGNASDNYVYPHGFVSFSNVIWSGGGQPGGNYILPARMGDLWQQGWYADASRKPTTPDSYWIRSATSERAADPQDSPPFKLATLPGMASDDASSTRIKEPREYQDWYDLCESNGCVTEVNYDTYKSGRMTRREPKQNPSGNDVVITPEDSTTIIREAPNAPEWEPYRTQPEPEPEPEPQVNPGSDEDIEKKKQQYGPVVWERENPDGSRTWKFEDGTEYTVYPDGTQQWKRSDGTVQWRFPDGTYRQYDPRTGQELTVYPDGSTRWRQYPSPYPRPWPGPDAAPSEEIFTAPGTRPAPNPNTQPQPEPIQRPSDPPVPSPNPTGPNTPPPPEPPTTPSYSCPPVPKAVLLMPPIDFEDRFPFSLIILAKNTLGQLVGTPRAPVFDLPMLGQQDMSRFDSYMAVIRNVWLVIIGGILMPLMFYRLIKGKDE